MDRDGAIRRAAVRAGQSRPATFGRGRAVRLADDVYAGDRPIHVTLCAQRAAPFRDPTVARMVCDAVETCARQLDYELAGYCLMPDHVHVVVSPACSETALAVFLRRLKSYTTNRYQRLVGPARLWRHSARDRVKRPREDLRELVAYVANNPVRRGLIQRWQDWPYTKVFVDV